MLMIVNRFTTTGPAAEFERAFAGVSEILAAQPGFIWHRLVRSHADPALYINVAEWADGAAFERAVAAPELRDRFKALRALASSDPQRCTAVLERRA